MYVNNYKSNVSNTSNCRPCGLALRSSSPELGSYRLTEGRCEAGSIHQQHVLVSKERLHQKELDGFLMENPIKMDYDWGYPYFRKPLSMFPYFPMIFRRFHIAQWWIKNGWPVGAKLWSTHEIRSSGGWRPSVGVVESFQSMNRIGIQPDAFQVPLQLYSLDPAIARLRDVSIPI